MNITFLKGHSNENESGNIIFFAKVDGKTVKCIVTDEALQDYRPANAREDPKQLFERYRADLEKIAKKKILAPEFNGEEVRITSADMH